MKIRKFKKEDVREIFRLKNAVYKKFNSSEFFEKGAVEKYLSFTNLKKSDDELLKFVSRMEIFFVAEENSKIIGYVSGTKSYLTNLFVYGNKHRKGIGKKLLDKFEKEVLKTESRSVKIKASLYAIPFYERCGYKKTTGIRNFRGLKIQPMIKKF